MNAIKVLRGTWLFGVIAVGIIFGGQSAPASELWRLEFKKPPAWHRIMPDGGLLLMGAGGLARYDAETGTVRWTRADLKGVARANVHTLGSDDLVLVPVTTGKRRKRKTTLYAVDLATGETIWRIDAYGAALGGVVPVPARDMAILFADVKAKKRKNSGTYMQAHRLSDGALLWQTKYTGTKARLLGGGSRRAGRGARGISGLDRYPAATIDGDTLYIPYLGIHAYDLATGTLKWGTSFKVGDGALRHARAAPLIDGDVIYAAGAGMVYAFDRATGKQLWRAKLRGGPTVSELRATGDVVLARLGGTFTTGAKLLARKPFGVVAINRDGGKVRWRYLDAEDGITNLVIDHERGLVIFADAAHVVGLSLKSGIPRIESPLRWDRLFGIFKKKSSGFAIGGGFSKSSSLGGSKGGGGMLGMGSSGIDYGDLPLTAELHGRDVIVRGQHDIMIFDPDMRLIQWSTLFSDPEIADRAVIETGTMPAISPKSRSYYIVYLEIGKKRRKHLVLSVLGVNWRNAKVVSRIDLAGGKNWYFRIDPAHDRLYRFDIGRKLTRIGAYGL